MKINIHARDGEVCARYELPPEEVIESAAARLRPILLEREDCSHTKALAALGYFCRTSPRDAEWSRAARTEWRSRTSPSTREQAGYWALVSDAATGEERDLDAHGLAMAWVYGDVVYHDPERRRQADAFGLLARFRAAVPLVTWGMVGTIELLNFIRALNEAGLLQLRQEVSDEQVALKTTCWDEPVQMYYAPVGTEAPSLATSPLPQGWLPLNETTDLSVFQHDCAGQLVHATDSQANTALPSQRKPTSWPDAGSPAIT
jgi:hypothetical protein